MKTSTKLFFATAVAAVLSAPAAFAQGRASAADSAAKHFFGRGPAITNQVLASPQKTAPATPAAAKPAAAPKPAAKPAAAPKPVQRAPKPAGSWQTSLGLNSMWVKGPEAHFNWTNFNIERFSATYNLPLNANTSLSMATNLDARIRIFGVTGAKGASGLSATQLGETASLRTGSLTAGVKAYCRWDLTNPDNHLGGGAGLSVSHLRDFLGENAKILIDVDGSRTSFDGQVGMDGHFGPIFIAGQKIYPTVGAAHVYHNSPESGVGVVVGYHSTVATWYLLTVPVPNYKLVLEGMAGLDVFTSRISVTSGQWTLDAHYSTYRGNMGGVVAPYQHFSEAGIRASHTLQ